MVRAFAAVGIVAGAVGCYVLYNQVQVKEQRIEGLKGALNRESELVDKLQNVLQQQQANQEQGNGQNQNMDNGSQEKETADSLASEIAWVDWKTGGDLAKQYNKPAILHFSGGASCLPCENLRLNVFPNPEVVKASQQFVCVKFDLKDDPEQNDPITKAAIEAFDIDLKLGVPQDIFVLPGWGAEPYIVLGDKIPSDVNGYAKYLNDWAAYLNER